MDELFIFVELKAKSFEKYIKARADVDKPGWLKCSNRLLDDDEFYEFTAAEFAAWYYIMSQSSIQQSPKVRLILDKVDAYRRKFSRDELRSAILKLKALNILKPESRNVDVTPTSRERNVDVPLGEERIGEDCIKAVVVVNTAREETPPSADALQNKFIGPVHPDLGGNSKREQALSKIPYDLQQEWVDTYKLSWLRNKLLKAIDHYSKNIPVELINDWEGKFLKWFAMEKTPEYKPKPVLAAVKELPFVPAGIPEPTDTDTEKALNYLKKIVGVNLNYSMEAIS